MVLLFNKTDTYNKKELKDMRDLKLIYKKIGYECYEIVAKDLKTLTFINSIMKGKVNMISGHMNFCFTFVNSFFLYHLLSF